MAYGEYPDTTLSFGADASRPIAFPSTLADGLIQVQLAQWEALIAWQKSLTAFNQELWDEWTCRYAGGVPIDA